MCWLIPKILRACELQRVAFWNFEWTRERVGRIKIPQSRYSDFKRLNYETSGIFYNLQTFRGRGKFKFREIESSKKPDRALNLQ